MKLINNNIFKIIVGILPTIFMFYILKKLFPFTGLGLILAIPIIIILNIIIIIIGITFTKKKKQPHLSLIWFGIVFMTIINTIIFFPQEFNPSVPKQLWNNFK